MAAGDLIPLTDRLFVVDSPTGGKFPLAYAFLVLGTDTRALLDPGCGPAACARVKTEYGVDTVINSHCHPDHVSGNHIFSDRELMVPAQRREEVGSIKRLSRRLMGPDPTVRKHWEHFVQEKLGLADYTPTQTFQDGDILDFGGISLEAVHTPGHLADHYCFREPVENIWLTFDMDMTKFGPFYGNPEADIHQFRASLETVRAAAPRVVASSHRLPVTENISEEIRLFGERFDRNERRLLRVLDRPRSLEEICGQRPLFGKYLPGMKVLYAFFEKTMIEKHLQDLLGRGDIILQDGKYGRHQG